MLTSTTVRLDDDGKLKLPYGLLTGSGGLSIL